jgi:hypothetical protein
MCLRRMLETGHMPNIIICYFIDMQRTSLDYNAMYSALIRRDILNNTSQPLPYNLLHYRTYMLRTKDGDQMGTHQMFDGLSERPAWTETVNGIRLPVSLSARYIPFFHPLKSRQTWQKDHELGCELWSNEDRIGMNLLDIDRLRTEGVTGRILVRSKPPGGWKRITTFNERLHHHDWIPHVRALVQS